MEITVRVNGPLARSIGQSRLNLPLPAGATLADLVTRLKELYPQATSPLDHAVFFMAGQHCSAHTLLDPGQEVSLLTPIAGGTVPVFYCL
jgi:molybdopterin converting factor small subunit